MLAKNVECESSKRSGMTGYVITMEAESSVTRIIDIHSKSCFSVGAILFVIHQSL